MSAEPAPVPVWSRYLLAIGGAVALLMLGAAAGLLFGLPGSPSAAIPDADSVDVGFAQDMSVHHEQAVQMASWERDRTADPQLRQLAFDIESGQSRQIGHMQGWLGLWGAAAQSSGPYMRWMSSMSGHRMGASATPGVARMPGMASDDELRRLRASSGSALDVLFLQLMLRHHEGGGEMLDYAAQRAEQSDVRNLASRMRSAQTSEATYLRALLAARGAAPLPEG